MPRKPLTKAQQGFLNAERRAQAKERSRLRKLSRNQPNVYDIAAWWIFHKQDVSEFIPSPDEIRKWITDVFQSEIPMSRFRTILYREYAEFREHFLPR